MITRVFTWFIAYVAPCFMVFGGLAGLWISTGYLVDAYSSATWPRTTATVIRSELGSETDSKQSADRTRYWPEVEYEYLGIKGKRWSDQRSAAFVARLSESGYEPNIFRPRRSRRAAPNWQQEQQEIAEWITRQPKPVGVMSCHDAMGIRLLDACRGIEIPVPEQVAVIGVDNDEVLCDLSEPPLTSVAHDLEQIGYAAAALLDRLMTGEDSSGVSPAVAPLGVVTRQSTDVVAISDDDVSRALHFIRRYACDGIGVDDVVDEVPLSRRTLERRFQKALKRSLHDEIINVQMERVKQLLRESEFTLDTIAHRAGFAYSSVMSTLFKKQFGQTPGQFRKLEALSGGIRQL